MSCPICQRAGNDRYLPFCSRRCADVDLGRWLTGGYSIPAEESAHSAEDGALDKAAEVAASERPDRLN